MTAQLHPCKKPDCLRKVSMASRYCCGTCAAADEGGYEIHAHSQSCQERYAERGEWTPAEAETRRAAEEMAARRRL